MGVANEYVLHGINTPGGTFLSQITNSRVSLGTQLHTIHGTGAESPQSTGIIYSAPTITFSTTAVATILTLCGNQCCASFSGGNLDLFLRRMAPQGTRDSLATGSAQRFRATLGMLCWNTIRLTQGQPAEVDCTITLAWDGTNAILAQAGSATVSGTPSGSARYTLGPVKINGSLIGSVQEVSIESNAKLRATGSDGDKNPSFVGLESWDPVINVKTYDAAVWGTFGEIAAISSATTAFIRAIAANGTPVAYGTTSHCSVGVPGVGGGGSITCEEVGGAGNGEVVTTIKITPVDSGYAGSPLACATGVAIS